MLMVKGFNFDSEVTSYFLRKLIPYFSHIGLSYVHIFSQIEAMEGRGIEPTNGTLAALSVGCSKTLQLDLAEDFLERISDTQLNYRHACNTLLAGCEIMVMHYPSTTMAFLP
jgi:hypothetical protein